ncbi:MAG: putative acetyl xylan esterase [Verrucomicrobiales bacterium]|nr:putative acetyl xylan esterase [Verrucomicrobiales bacterium]
MKPLFPFFVLLLFPSMLAIGSPADLVKQRGLPDVLKLQSGSIVTNENQWPQRRGEIVKIFEKEVYGQVPSNSRLNTRTSVVTLATNAMGGKATLKRVTIHSAAAESSNTIQMTLFIPNSVRSSPCFLLLNNRPATNADPSRVQKSDFWPAELLIEHGYAAAVMQVTDVAADNKNSWDGGIFRLFADVPRTSESWGTLAAWAWGASRCMDYLESDKAIDSSAVVVVGHSRGGKTALWAGAIDQRFAGAVSNESGSSGAALARGKKGEQIADITKTFPYWFCDNYRNYAGKPELLPVDQHELIALMAPRLAYVASANEDLWSDPASEFLGAVAASPVYSLFGLRGLVEGGMPQVGSVFHEGAIGYHLRAGTHNLTTEDWNHFIDFFDRHLTRKQP